MGSSISNSTLAEIEVASDVFSTDMYKTNDIAKKQLDSHDSPAITLSGINVGNYDLIIIGSPVWSGYPATPIHTLLDKLKEANYQGEVTSFHTDVGSLGDFVKIFNEWANGLNTNLPNFTGKTSLADWAKQITED